MGCVVVDVSGSNPMTAYEFEYEEWRDAVRAAEEDWDDSPPDPYDDPGRWGVPEEAEDDER